MQDRHDLEILLRSRLPLLVVETHEEQRVPRPASGSRGGPCANGGLVPADFDLYGLFDGGVSRVDRG